ncbi:MAG TPA: glutamate--tRNA ligase [Myxococcales bacterium]|nr:glutamate--tRNA ligase [Deltaproteobacteria bacterium]MBU53003.1 glutamate--tRNA ligase [Deltaproteobacteria bacterium]HAA55428.1 glutamate--tRNA ligase [Myxococcales bacterium]|tara:strand:- start:8647 stop:10122 length:1476 start_codon:yes stop_codon:yes gene_type:complete
MSVRVRFAPSPTGQLHVGGLRTALYNYLFARQHGGTFVLRIEDTDRKRFVDGATEKLIESTKWAGLTYDEGPHAGGEYGPYVQSERLHLYKQYVDQLLEEGKAYYAFDTPEDLKAAREKAIEQNLSDRRYKRDEMNNSLTWSEEKVKAWIDEGNPYVIRLQVPDDREEYVIQDTVRGEVKFHNTQVDDQVLLKADGFPTYHMACIVDDHLMGITHVIRGEEWLPSTAKHVLLYEMFGWEPPQWVHLPLLYNTDGSKMSKRKKIKGELVHVNVEDYQELNYQPEALINFLALLGWNPGDEREFFLLEDLVKEFSLGRVNKSGAIFDVAKFKWLNEQHLRHLDNTALAAAVKPHLEAADYNISSDAYLEQVVELMRERISFSVDLVEAGKYFFEDPQEYDKKTVKKRWKAQSAELAKEFAEKLEALETFNGESIEAALRSLAEEKEVGAGQLIHPTRLAVSGVGGGPGLFEMLETLGQETCVRRLRKAADELG